MPDPPRAAADIASIEVAHRGCFGYCPIYRVRLASDGTAQYEGLCFTPLLGSYEARLDSTAFSRIAQELVRSGFFLSDTLVNVRMDLPNYVVTVGLADGRRRAVTYGGSRGPLGERIEAVTSRLVWRFVAPLAHRECAT